MLSMRMSALAWTHEAGQVKELTCRLRSASYPNRTSVNASGIESGETMNGYSFSERVRSVLAMARDESARLHHEYVGTEHQLLASFAKGRAAVTR